MTVEEHDLASVTAFRGITVRQRQSGGWRVGFTIESDFSEFMDALEYQGKLMGMMRSTAFYRVRCVIEPERGLEGGDGKPVYQTPVEGEDR